MDNPGRVDNRSPIMTRSRTGAGVLKALSVCYMLSATKQQIMNSQILVAKITYFYGNEFSKSDITHIMR